MASEIYVGVDIEKISRVKKLLKYRKSSLEKIFSRKELLLNPDQIAGNFASKEAIKKALKWNQGFNLANVEILRDEFGRPVINFTNYFLSDQYSIDLSISNVEDFVVACAVIIKNG